MESAEEPLRRAAERIEKQRGLNSTVGRSNQAASHYSKPVSPAEPGSIALGLVALALGAAAVCGPLVAGTLVATLVGVQGPATLSLGIGTRPLRQGLGHLIGGVIIMLCATFILLRWPPGTENVLGVWVGLALLAGGGSTIWLSWCTRHDDASPAAG